jgi:hypothetical protein
VPRKEETNGKRVGCVQQIPARPGTPDCPVVHRTVSGALGWSPVKWLLSGIDSGVRLKFTGLFGGAPDCLVSHPRRTRRSWKKELGDMAKIHQTVCWCTGLSGEPTVANANGRPHNLRATCGRANGRLGTPDCPVCTGQCPMHQPIPRTNGRLLSVGKDIKHRT